VIFATARSAMKSAESRSLATWWIHAIAMKNIGSLAVLSMMWWVLLLTNYTLHVSSKDGYLPSYLSQSVLGMTLNCIHIFIVTGW